MRLLGLDRFGVCPLNKAVFLLEPYLQSTKHVASGLMVIREHTLYFYFLDPILCFSFGDYSVCVHGEVC